MFRSFVVALLLLSSLSIRAQIQVSKLVGNNSADYGLGYGGFLKFSYPVIEAADVTFEVGVNIFQLKNDKRYGWITVPVKAGFHYTLNQTGTDFYVEPQVGYNAYGIESR